MKSHVRRLLKSLRGGRGLCVYPTHRRLAAVDVTQLFPATFRRIDLCRLLNNDYRLGLVMYGKPREGLNGLSGKQMFSVWDLDKKAPVLG